ncbi:unnamed protein product [Rotaria magnacalcarata]|uniref:EF-hand domain-containing protein n=1 Tax=Rotaria magnacalcarata TaxID=392030 RepID=A0A819DYL3_9BILA|nr:unnamed protein product [Rotaria magnacalcarata]CAF2157295.1 unnamed protein product [Rotaria magnacalcarata]CAF2233557.1 unnamed protein product [Rotaria magnacalcarata]CAF3841228.1 unnamed protein product [Rotaria magnacalcarata]CAF3891589.1 unnamed protein product [Rotaria magnacalcarata]
MPVQRQNANDQSSSSSNSFLQQIFESRLKSEIDENDLLILLNDTELSRSFDRHSKFTIDHCKLLISAVVHSKNTLSLPEFVSVINLLYTWRNFFRRHDLDRNGIIEPYALVNILNSLRFNLSPSTLEIIVKRYSTRVDNNSPAKISFEHYVQLCARLTLLNNLMQQKSTNDSPRNICSFSIDEFMQLALNL